MIYLELVVCCWVLVWKWGKPAKMLFSSVLQLFSGAVKWLDGAGK
jgi:hypothetical protein